MTMRSENLGSKDAAAASVSEARSPDLFTVMVVEDHADARELLEFALRGAGRCVFGAASGEEALELLAARRVDAAIVDIGLPHMDGFEVARRARERFGSGLLFLALTGYGQPEDRRAALEAGFDDHFNKPTDLSALGALLTSRDYAR
jgi:hypothetical protein